MSELLTQVHAGNTTLQWLVAAAMFTGTVAGLGLFRRALLRWLDPRTPVRAYTRVLVQHTRYTFLGLIGLAVGASVLRLTEQAPHVVRVLITLAFVLQVAWWGHGVIDVWATRTMRRRRAVDVGSITIIRVVGVFAKGVLWALIGLVALATFGIDVTALVAGLGVGGIAVALAVQNIAGDLLASMSIILDRPFVVGQFIQVGDFLGTVEEIGLKSTRIRSLSGEQLVIGNGDLLSSRIRNYGRMVERRALFGVGIEYGTPPDLVDAVPGMLREIVESQERVRFDRAHFKAYGDFALLYEVVYYVLSPDYNRYMDAQQAINGAIYRRFAAAGIAFAFPTQTTMLRRDAAGDTAARSDGALLAARS